MELYKPVQNVQ